MKFYSKVIDKFYLEPEAGPGRQEAFDNYAIEANTMLVRMMLVCLLIVIVVLWPTDFIVFPISSDQMAAISNWRIQALLLFAGGLAASRFINYFRSRPITIFYICSLINMALMGYHFGSAGGIETLLFDSVIASPFLTAMLMIRLKGRAVITFLIPTVFFVSFFGFNPDRFIFPEALGPISYLIGICIILVIMGDIAYHIFRSSYFHRFDLINRTEELNQIKANLEYLVHDRTADIDEANVRLRALAANMINVQEEERKRLSRELHDELGQHLARLRMEQHIISDLISTNSVENETIQEAIIRSDRVVDSISKSTRKMINFLRPERMLDEGLAAALSQLVDEFKSVTDIDSEVDIDLAENSLGKREISEIYRIVQEALTNVLRHAKAGAVKIDCSDSSGVLRLKIVDDGIGMEYEKVGGHGFGLLGMTERVRNLNGSITISSAEGAGTTIYIEMPIEEGVAGI